MVWSEFPGNALLISAQAMHIFQSLIPCALTLLHHTWDFDLLASQGCGSSSVVGAGAQSWTLACKVSKTIPLILA